MNAKGLKRLLKSVVIYAVLTLLVLVTLLPL